MKSLRWAMVALWAVAAAPALAQTDMDRCTAATPQFPQACPCVIDRAQAAGITGPTLSRLLSNDVGGLPIEVFQQYGLIYVGCIQEAVVAGGPGAVNPPAVPVAPPPAMGAAPAPAAAPQPGVPTIIGRTPTDPGRDPWRMTLRDPRAPGEWGFVTMGRTGQGFGFPGAHDGQGSIVALDCRGGDFVTPRLILGGVRTRTDLVDVQIDVRRGDGTALWSERRPWVPVEGAFLVTGLRAGLADAIRAGSRLTLTFGDGAQLSFGLDGSNRAIGPGVCGADRFPTGSFPLGEAFVPDTRWTVATSDDGGLERPFATTTAALQGQVVRLEMTCDRRVALRAGWLATNLIAQGAALPVDLRLDVQYSDSGRIALDLTPAEGLWVSDPLTADQLDRIAAARVLYGSIVYFEDGGGFQNFALALDGFAEAVAGLACPVVAPVADMARTDLTGQGLSWRASDFGVLYNGMVPNPPPAPGVVLGTPEDVPAPFISCQRDLFFLAGDWAGPRYVLRLTVDGDPATAREVEFLARRSQSFADFDWSDEWVPRLADARTLRATLLGNPERDVLYPLDGLAAALQAAGCPS